MSALFIIFVGLKVTYVASSKNLERTLKVLSYLLLLGAGMKTF